MPRIFHMWIAVEVERSFPDDEVNADPEGREGDVVPYDAAIEQLTAEIREMLETRVRVVTIEIEPTDEVRLSNGFH